MLSTAAAPSGPAFTREKVAGLVRRPDGSTAPMRLRDDGSGGDEFAGDGLYSGRFDAGSTGGAYTVALDAVNDGSARVVAGESIHPTNSRRSAPGRATEHCSLKPATLPSRRSLLLTSFFVIALLVRLGGVTLHASDCGLHVGSHGHETEALHELHSCSSDGAHASEHSDDCLLCQLSHQPSALDTRDHSTVSYRLPIVSVLCAVDQDPSLSPRDLNTSAPLAPPRS